MGAKKIKPGRVHRLDPMVDRFVAEKKRPGESTSALLRRLFGLPERKTGKVQTRHFYLLPESRVAFETIEEARGEAILRAVKTGKKKPTEKPILVREAE